MSHKVKKKLIKERICGVNNTYREMKHLYNLIRLNYVVELKLDENYLYEKGDDLAIVLEEYFIDEGYDIIVECYTEKKNAYLIIDCEDEAENMWNLVSFIYTLLVKFNINNEIIW